MTKTIYQMSKSPNLSNRPTDITFAEQKPFNFSLEATIDNFTAHVSYGRYL